MTTKTSVPATGLKGLKENFKVDLISGFLVFLIALPLCLGISKASGYPPIAGIYTAIVGGLIATFFSNSQLTIKGPAAGLIVIALGAVQDLGHGNAVAGYKLALAVGVVAGVLQIVLGLVKAGRFGDFFPASVIHGMLAAIGIIIAAKQIHIALGVTPEGKETFDLIKEIPNSIIHMNPEVALIGIASVLILFLMPLIKHKLISMIPAPMVVLLVAIPLGLFFDLQHSHDYDLGTLHFHINPEQLLVALPESFWAGITLPDFSQILSMTSIKYVIMFAMVGSIESLLSGKAIDTLDPYKRKTNLNQDLTAVGIGNTISSFIGGLPMISEIVRSSANINNGAKTKWANFFHGLFLFLFVLLAAPLIQMIPNAALGAMLIYTGYRLASPSEFRKTYKIGSEQLLLFLITLVVTLATDLLIGVGVGILVKFLMHFFNGAGWKDLFSINAKINKKDHQTYTVEVTGPAIFSNYLGMKRILSDLPKSANVQIDFSKATIIDHTFMENLHHMENDFTNEGGQLHLLGFEKHHYSSQHPFAARKAFRNPLNPKGVVKLTKRQKALENFAMVHHMDFDPTMLSSSILKMNFASFGVARYMKYAENILFKSKDNYSVFLADVNIESYSTLSKRSYNMTVMHVSNLDLQLPDFILEEETFLDFINELKGIRDIDFAAHPEFSKKYYLKGEDESAIRGFFTDDILRFFERSDGYYVESKNNNLLIHKRPALMSTSEMAETLIWLDSLMELVHKKQKV